MAHASRLDIEAVQGEGGNWIGEQTGWNLMDGDPRWVFMVCARNAVYAKRPQVGKRESLVYIAVDKYSDLECLDEVRDIRGSRA